VRANGAPVSSVEDLRSAVEKSKSHIALLVQRGENRLFVPVRVALPTRLPQPFLDEPTTESLHADVQATLAELLAGKRGSEVMVVSAIYFQDAATGGRLVATVRGSLAKAVDYRFIAFRPELSANAGFLAKVGMEPKTMFEPIASRPAAELDFDYQDQVRRNLPCLSHRQL